MTSQPALDIEAIFDALPAAYLLLAPDPPRFTICGASAAYLRATHTSLTGPSSIKGRPMFEAFPDPPEDGSASGTRNLMASLMRALTNRAADMMPVQHYDIRLPDGTWVERYWSPRNTPVLRPDRTVECLIHEVEDVTAVMKAQAAARKAQEAVESAEAALLAAEAALSDEHVNLKGARALSAKLRAQSHRLRAESERLRADLRGGPRYYPEGG